jgi:hypothetical protein
LAEEGRLLDRDGILFCDQGADEARYLDDLRKAGLPEK